MSAPVLDCDICNCLIYVSNRPLVLTSFSETDNSYFVIYDDSVHQIFTCPCIVVVSDGNNMLATVVVPPILQLRKLRI